MKKFYLGCLASFAPLFLLTGAAGVDYGVSILFLCGLISMIIGPGIGCIVVKLPSASVQARSLGTRVLVVMVVSVLIGLVVGLFNGLVAPPLGVMIFAISVCAGLGVLCTLIASVVMRQFLLGMVAGVIPWLFVGGFWIAGFLLYRHH